LRVRAGRSVALRSKPRGRVLARVGARTQFGSPTTLTVAAQRGGWVGVTSTDLPNGRLGWLKATGAPVSRSHTRLAIRVDLSRRRLQLVDGRRVLRNATVGIGRPGSSTPTGRFAITDKLSGSAYGPYYGCCILALSGHQTNTPAGWRGGDRLAIHGTNDPGSIGVPSSAGCLHARARDLRVLLRRVPLGTPVFIRR
jgi:lipoprotein-anchoring transpeptidase ErfK/SrfK